MPISALFTAVSGMQANQQYISVVANNLANVNTTGFKGSRALFADTLSETLSGSGPNTSQIGLGVTAPSVNEIFSPGALQNTGQPSDMALEGGGFFVVNNPLTNEHLFTRAGAFSVDANGFLTTPTGQRLLGVGPTGKLGDPLIELQIPPNVGGVPVVGYSIDQTGVITGSLQDGTSSVLGKVTLENFKNPQGLAKAGENLFRNTAKAGEEYSTYHPGATDDVGSIRSGFLELSNVDLSTEFSNMILAQRGLQANARVITASDEILQEIIGMKH